jgi:hypothetical protein
MRIELIQQRMYAWSDAVTCDIPMDTFEITQLSVTHRGASSAVSGFTSAYGFHSCVAELRKIYKEHSDLPVAVRVWDGEKWLSDIITAGEIKGREHTHLLKHLCATKGGEK